MSEQYLYRAIREALERSWPSEEQARAIRSYQEQLDKLASGFSAREYMEDISKALERQRTLLPYYDFEEMRRALEHAVRPFITIDFARLRETYKLEYGDIETALRAINSSIAEATFLGEVEFGAGEEGPNQEQSEEPSQGAVEERLIEVFPAEIVTKLKKVDFAPLRLLDQILRSPEHMRNLSPIEFEQFVATLIDELGFEDVVITPRSGDHGRDILASKRVLGIPILFAFECKRYGPDKPVGVEILRALLGTISHGPTKANKGVLVTTSRFTSGARRFLLTEPSLDGKDFNGIMGWLGVVCRAK